MSDTKKILIIGGGFSGMSAAIAMRQAGLHVDLIEIDPQWRSYGAGISLGGPTLRAFKQLGILEAFLEAGDAHDGVTMHLGNGHPIAELPTPRLAGPDVPGGGAIMRPVLAKLMATATRAAGVRVLLGCTFSAIDAQSGAVTLSDGTQATYDLIVGADGVNSKVRETLFAHAPKPRYTGQSVWRCILPRPAEVKSTMMWIGPRTKPGVNPTSKTDMYMFMTEHRPNNTFVDPSEFVSTMRGLLADFSAPLLQQLREQINEDSQIVFRPLEALLMPAPWYQSKVVLIGDAVHATTPHLASGACIGIEDGIVLAQSLMVHADLSTALAAFQTRRFERCRMVVENSLRLGELEMANGDKDEQGRIMGESLRALAAPI